MTSIMPKIVDRKPFVRAALTEFGQERTTVTRKEVMDVMAKHGLDYPAWLTNDPNCRIGRGEYLLPVMIIQEVKKLMADEGDTAAQVVDAEAEFDAVPLNQAAMVVQATPTKMAHAEGDVSLVPQKMGGYVPFGHYNDVRTILASKEFYPIYITGLSGNGKTEMVTQVCAMEKRELVRTNITVETDEDDLIGGFRLVDGKTVWHDGPVIQAMQRGSVLLLDEVDLGSNKLMCLQPVLEGKSIYVKKINRLVFPAPGFTVVATANTKGKGSDDGRFIGTNVLNEAFLERFSVTMEQEYPSLAVERKILNNVLKKSSIEDKDFVERLVQWADIVRKSFNEGAVSEIISTRRLVHICTAFTMFKQNREKAIMLCLNRFDQETKEAFMALYKKVDDSMNPNKPAPAPAQPSKSSSEEIAF